MRDLYKSIGVNLKMILWSISDYNPNDVESAKYTSDGILKYADPKVLFTRIVHEIQNASSVEDMMNKLYAAAKS
jgi:hypothetical protein